MNRCRLIAVCLLLWTAPLYAQLGDPPVAMVATPGAAAAGLTVRVQTDGLVNDRSYQLQLTGSSTLTVLSFTWRGGRDPLEFVVPAALPGRYRLRLVHSGLGTVVDAAQPFRVLPTAQIVAAGSARAGERLEVRVDSLDSGRLVLRYAGGRLEGPLPVEAGSVLRKPLLPADRPAVLPATVELVAELWAPDGGLAQRAVHTLQVSRGATGPFALPSGFTSTRNQLRPGERTRVSGQLQLQAGTDLSTLRVAPFWRSNTGTLVPLASPDISVDAAGALSAELVAPSFGSMSAVLGGGTGSVVFAVDRPGKFGRNERVFAEVPGLEIVNDADPDPDLTVLIRERLPNETRPLADAVVQITPGAPLQVPEVDLDPEQLSLPGCAAGYCATGFGISRFHGFGRVVGELGQVNQVFDTLQATPPEGYEAVVPPPSCGPSFYRRFTDADGRVEFVFRSNVQDGFFALPDLRLSRIEPVCTPQPDGQGGTRQVCQTAEQTAFEFTITAYTLHTGAGNIDADGLEVPTVWEARYDLDTEVWQIRPRSPATGPWQTFQTSATLQLEVGRRSGPTPTIPIERPRMWSVHESGSSAESEVPVLEASHASTTFGPFINFDRSPGAVPQFSTVQPPQRAIAFHHFPGVAGSISAARLRMRARDGQWFTAGDFVRQNDAGCALDSQAGQLEEWRLVRGDVGPLSQAMRFPDSLYLAEGESRQCGEIEVENALGHRGRHGVCFQWVDPPAYFSAFDRVTIDDQDLTAVSVRGQQTYADDSTRSGPIPPILGEQPSPAGPRTNGASNLRAIDDLLVGGVSTQETRAFRADVADQFSQPAGDISSPSLDAQSPSSEAIPIGTSRWETIVDVSIPLLRWYWGIPEVLSAEVFADLNLAAEYFLGGTLTVTGERERVDLRASAAFYIEIIAGVDVDVLFGLLFDAGAAISGRAISEMPVEVIDNVSQDIEPCFTFRLDFYAWFDPCPLCPTPRVEVNENFINAQDPANCSQWDGPTRAAAKMEQPLFGREDARRLFRHPAVAFDRDGNGHLLALNDSFQLRATRLFGTTPDDASVLLSTAPAIRHVRVVYTARNRALAVWAENALDAMAFANADDATREANQHLVYAEWDGASWSAKADLTAAGVARGEAHPAIAACYDGDAGCPAGGEAGLVWQRFSRDLSGDSRSALLFARFVSGSWGASEAVAPTLSRVLDMTPSLSYLGSAPAVVWIRNAEPGSGALTQVNPLARQLWYRVIGVGNAQAAGSVPPGSVAPSLLARAPDTLFLAYTQADSNTGFLGTRQALHTARATCTAGTCNFSWKRLADGQVRSIYGERPLLVDNGGTPTIVFRALRFGEGEAVGGAIREGDPLGTALISGDLLRIETNFDSTRARVAPITNDGAIHFGHAAALDPSSRGLVALSVPHLLPGSTPLRAKIKAIGSGAAASPSKQLDVGGGVQLSALPGGPDLVLEQFASPGAPWEAGQSIDVFMTYGNRGDAFDPAIHGELTLTLRLDDAAGVSAPLATRSVPAVAAGSGFNTAFTLTLPAGTFADEAHTLYASLEGPGASADADGGNEAGTLDYAGLPAPEALRSELIPGVPFAQLTWAHPGDARIAGFRVYADDGDGVWRALGSSRVNGFLDLSARYGVSRRYAVASYSLRGVESERSPAIDVRPKGLFGDRAFADGFEAAELP